MIHIYLGKICSHPGSNQLSAYPVTGQLPSCFTRVPSYCKKLIGVSFLYLSCYWNWIHCGSRWLSFHGSTATLTMLMKKSITGQMHEKLMSTGINILQVISRASMPDDLYLPCSIGKNDHRTCYLLLLLLRDQFPSTVIMSIVVAVDGHRKSGYKLKHRPPWLPWMLKERFALPAHIWLVPRC